MLDGLVAVETPVASVLFRCFLKGFLVLIQGRGHMIAIDRIPLQHSIVGNQALSTLGQEDLVAEFHRLQCLAPLDQICSFLSNCSIFWASVQGELEGEGFTISSLSG